jgi:putative heme uptake system protein
VTTSPAVEDLAAPEVGGAPRTLLVWDAPNMDMALTSLLGRQPLGQERPRFDAVGRWLLELADESEDAGEVEACVFANVPEGAAGRMGGWVKALRSFGYAVFVKPKHEGSDVDSDMLAHVQRRSAEGDLARLVVASGDGQAFREPLEELAAQGVEVIVLAFAEEATYALTSSLLRFFDLEDVPEAFKTSLPRTRLDALPREGRWLPPTAPLRRLLTGGPSH